MEFLQLRLQRARGDRQRAIQGRADYGPEQGPWRSVEAVELATLSWVTWFNTERLHGYLGDLPPAEFEDAYHAPSTTQVLVASLHKSRVGQYGKLCSSSWPSE